jgi:flagellar hook-length control protein FliK
LAGELQRVSQISAIPGTLAVTSNLTIGPVSPSAPAASQPAGHSGPLGAFGAMLDGVQSSNAGRPRGFSHAGSNSPAPAQNTAHDTAAEAASDKADTRRASRTGFSSPADASEDTTEADGTPPRLLHELVSALGDLNQAESDGGPIDDKLLKRVKDAIDAIAAYLSGQPQLANDPAAAQPEGDDAVASATDTDKGARDAAALAQARDSLSRLADKLGALSSGLGKDQADLASKLEDLAKQLDPKSLAQTTLADLGLTGKDGTPPDTRLASAINALIDGKQQSSTAGQPKLASASLKLPDGTTLAGDKESAHSLDGKAPATAPAAPQQATADASGKTGAETRTDQARADQPKADDTADIAGAIRDATQQPAASADSAAQAGATAVAAPNLTASATPDIRQVQSAYQTAPINLPQMAVEVARHVQQGSDHFQIRLDPPEMGRVNVSLAIDSSGTVNAHLTVERSETLDFLKRDQANLQQALQQAGLDAGKTNLQFSLSQNPFARQDGTNDPNAGNYGSGRDADADQSDAVAAVAATTVYRGTASAGGLNLFV